MSKNCCRINNQCCNNRCNCNCRGYNNYCGYYNYYGYRNYGYGGFGGGCNLFFPLLLLFLL